MKKTNRLALGGLLAALALVLSLLEGILPLGLLVPLPGIKLGLSNIVTLVALYALGPGGALGVVLCRIATLYLITGNFTGLFLSLLGALLSWLVMALVARCSAFSIYGVSILGAAAHNIGQILGACLLLGGIGPVYYLPLLLCAGLFTGPLVAKLAALCLPRVPGMGRHSSI